MLLGGVQHHFDHAFDVAVGGSERTDIHPETAGDRGFHLFPVEQFALDFARLDDLLSKALKVRLGSQLKAERLHAADEPSLHVPHRCE